MIYGEIERDLTKTACITVKTEETCDSSQEQHMALPSTFVRSMCIRHYFKKSRETVHLPYRKQKTNFYDICFNKSLINEIKQ
jgi:hypothetical protein